MYTVIMKETATGEVKNIPMDLDWLESSVSWWTDGNFGCDCNRIEVFYDKDFDEVGCSNGKYEVICVILEDGERIAIDDPF